MRALRGAYRRLPEGVRYCLRPLNAVEESASFLPSGPRLALQELVRACRGIAFALRHRSEVVLLDGASRLGGAPLRVVTDLALGAAAYWTDLLFASEPARRVVGATRGSNGSGWGALPAADLALLRLGRLTRRRARAGGYLVVPAWVQVSLDTRRPVDAIVEGERSGRSSRKNDIRRARKAGLRAVLARDSADVHHFLEAWCNPFVQTRFGASALVPDQHWARQMARVCSVLWIERDDARVGGALLEPRGRELRNLAFGVRDPAAVSEGVLSACYWFMIEHAVREGYDALQLGSSRPVLSDGVLRHKLKWGGRLTPVRQWEYVAVGVDRQSEVVRALLAAHPLIAEEAGRLVAVTSGDALQPSSGLSGVLRI